MIKINSIFIPFFFIFFSFSLTKNISYFPSVIIIFLLFLDKLNKLPILKKVALDLKFL